LKQDRKIIIIIAQIAAWVCFFFLPLIFSPRPFEDNFHPNFIVYLICNNIFLIGFYYFNTLFLIPKLLNEKSWHWYVLSCIAFFLTFMYLPREIASWINGTEELIPRPANFGGGRGGGHSSPQFKRNRFTLFSGNTAIFFFVYTIGTCITVVQRLIASERTKQVIEHEKVNTELSFLKSQVNPHFFFNTLNNIYSLAVTKNDNTAPAVMKLSSIMRYILTETQSNFVPLQIEIDFVKNFIDLQLVRLTDKVSVDFKCEGSISDKIVAPLLFIPFIENAFKYGISTKEKTSITILLTAKENAIDLDITNTIVKSEKTIHETTGIGINNVKRRLELLYPEKHKLIISETDNLFFVHLEIIVK